MDAHSGSVVAYLDERRDRYLDDLRHLVGIDSGTFDKAGVDEVTSWLEQRLLVLGYHVDRWHHEEWGDDLVARRHGTGQGRILLLGHSDTVFPLGTARARPMTILGDKILGPGTCDMKGGLLTGLYALEALNATGHAGYESITFLCVSDEETDKRHSVPLIRAESRKADVALTLEAARENGDIVVARKAVRWYTIQTAGRAAHAGVEPEKGSNAILALAHHILALHDLNGFRPGVTVNAGVIQGGRFASIVPEAAELRVDVRAFTDEDMEAVDRELRERLARIAVPGVRIEVTIEPGSVCAAMEQTPEAAALETLAQAAARELGFEVRGARTGGVSDANYIAEEGTPVLDGLGPVGGLDHGPDEYIRLSSIVPRTALLANLIMAIGQRGRA